MVPADLPAAWRAEAAILRKRQDERGALLLEQNADELETAISAYLEEPVTPEQAEREGVCTAEAVRAAVRGGRVENVGTPTRHKVRRKDLPRGRKGQPPSFGKAAKRAARTANRRRGL